MEPINPFSTIQVDSVRVIECSMWMNPEPPAGIMTTDTNIELTEPAIQTGTETADYTDMSLCLTVATSDNDERGEQRMRFTVKVRGRVHATEGVGLTPHAARVAALQQLYPQACAYLAMLCGMAQLPAVSIPTADPEALAIIFEQAATAESE